MENNKKTEFWMDCLVFFISFQIANNVSNYLGVKDNGIFTWSFVKQLGVYLICYFPIKIIITIIRNQWRKIRSEKRTLGIIIAIGIFSIIQAFIALVTPEVWNVYPLGFIFLSAVNLYNGIKQLKGSNKTIGNFLIALGIALFFVAIIQGMTLAPVE